MQFLRHLPLPERLPSRLWLLSLPSALFSFERRQKLPLLPLGRLRLLGLPLLAAGAVLMVWAWRQPAPPSSSPAVPHHSSLRPATLAGLLVLGGVALLLRSLVLAAYVLGLGWAAGSNALTLEEPTLPQPFVRPDESERQV